jgi:hypothetical protein
MCSALRTPLEQNTSHFVPLPFNPQPERVNRSSEDIRTAFRSLIAAMTSASSPAELRAALAELSSSLPESDALNPLRLVKARVELLLDDYKSAAQDAGIFLNSATDMTDPFFSATARSIRALAAESMGQKGEAVQELMSLETMCGMDRDRKREVDSVSWTEPESP